MISLIIVEKDFCGIFYGKRFKIHKEVKDGMPDNKEKYAKLQEVIEKRKGERGAVMPCLQEAMNIFGYVPQDVQEMIADGLGVTLSEVYGVSTFYSHIFQHKAKVRYFVLNKETKEWRDWQTVIIERHTPEKLTPKESNIIEELKV